MRYLYTILIVLAMGVVMPQDVMASANIAAENIRQPKITVVKESTVRVVDAEGETMYVYDVAGVAVQTVYVDSPDKIVNLGLHKGCYIVKVGKTVRKIHVTK